jgi:hypothetical protein
MNHHEFLPTFPDFFLCKPVNPEFRRNKMKGKFMRLQIDELERKWAESVTGPRSSQPEAITKRGSRANLALALAVVCALSGLATAGASTLTVLNALDKGAGSLRNTIAGANNGDIIVFDPSLAGQTITLTSGQLSIKQDLSIEGLGADSLTISGNDVNRVFDIAEGTTVTIAGLTITHGAATSGAADRGAGGGGGILNAGNLTLDNVVVAYNIAMNHGGGIANASFAVLTVANTAFVGNQAASRDPFAFAEGGAIYNNNRGCVAMVTGCTFITNRAIGANGGLIKAGQFAIGQCNGGAIHNGLTDMLIVNDSTFIGNQAVGGSGGSATSDASGNLGSAVGGAIANDENCDGGGLIVNRCTFNSNQAIGGMNNSGGASGPAVGSGGGGAIYHGGVGTVTDCTFIGNQARGGDHNTAGSGGFQVGLGGGGAIKNNIFSCQVTLTISGCVFNNNQAVGGVGNSGGVLVGTGAGGVLFNLQVFNLQGVAATITNSTLTGNAAIGGAGASGSNGGNGLGGAVANLLGATLTLRNSSIRLNAATGGPAGARGSVGLGLGGGAYLAADGVACRDALTSIVANTATTSDNDLFGVLGICP